MAIATQEVFAHTEATVEVWDLGEPTAARTLVVQGDRVGVSLTNTPDITGNVGSRTLGRFTLSLANVGGVSNEKATAVSATSAAGVALDGTWEFEDIDGVTAATEQGTPVYFDSATGALSTTDDAVDDIRVGVVNYPATYTKAAGKAPVKIGA